MKANSHFTDMDFRVIPSVVPLQSPSPDKKNANNITPTLSPTPIQIKKNITPHKKARQDKSMAKTQMDLSTEMKYATHSPGRDYPTALKEKENIIQNLRNIIDSITENGRRTTLEDAQQNELKNEVKILTIENQKLVNIIEKMSKKKDNNSRAEEARVYQQEMDELVRKSKQDKKEHEEEQKQLKRLYKALNVQYKSVENEKNELDKENKMLLKILKDKNESEKKLNEKSRVSEGSEQESEKSHKSIEKMTLLKIKEQYSENMKLLRDGLVKEIEETFDTMRIALEGLGSRVNNLAIRVESIEKILWQKMRSLQQSMSEEKIPETELAKNKKSEIYIEEGPDSSHQTSKDDFSQAQESSRHSSQLQEQLTKVKAELEQIRFKYDKICLDTSNVQYSKRVDVSDRQLEEEYERMLSEMARKDKQIEVLNTQIKSISEENIELSRMQEDWQKLLTEKEDLIGNMRSKHSQELDEIQQETQLKVKMLIENYEKEIDLLRKEISLKNNNMQQESESINLEKSETQKRFHAMNEGYEKLATEKQNLLSEIQILKNKLKQRDVEEQIKSESWLQQKLGLEKRLSDHESSLRTDRAKRQEIEQEVILQMVQLSQNKREIEETKTKNQELNEMIMKMNEKLEEDRNQMERCEKKKEELAQELANEKRIRNEELNRMNRINEIITESDDGSILEEIIEIKELLERESEAQKTETEGEQQGVLIRQGMEKMHRMDDEINQIKRILLEKEQKCIQQEAKIIELEGICELNRSKFQQQQNLYRQLLSKSNSLEEELLIATTNGNKSKHNEEIITKIKALKQLEEQRRSKYKSILDSTLNIIK